MKILLKVIFSILVLAVSPLNTMASVFRIESKSTMQESRSLGAKRSMMVISTSIDGLVVTDALNVNTCNFTGNDSDGRFRYEVLIDLSAESKHRFIVAKKGSTSEGEIEQIFKEGQVYYYFVDEVETPIYLTDQSQMSDFHPNNSEAVVIFNSEISDLHINFDSELPCVITGSQSPTGTRLYTATIDFSNYKSLGEEIAAMQTEIDTLTEKVDSMTGQEAVDIYDQIEASNEKISEKQTLYDMLGNPTFEISGDDTNVLSVTVLDLAPKSKKTYSVQIATTGSDYAQLLSSAKNAADSHKYEMASGFYTQALTADGAPSDLSAITEAIDVMNSCLNYERLGKKCLLDAKKIKESSTGDVDLNQVKSLYEEAIKCFSSIRGYMNDDKYTPLIGKIQAAIDGLPLIIEGVVSDAQNSTIKLAGVIVSVSGTAGYESTVTDSDGHFHLEIKGGFSGYSTISFDPTNIKGYKREKRVSLSSMTSHTKLQIKLFK